MLSCRLQHQTASFDFKIELSLTKNLLGILGNSGAGKSTLLRYLAGLNRPQQGTICFKQRTLLDTEQQIFVAAHQRHIALIFQQAQLFAHLNVKQNLLYGYKLLKQRQAKFQFEQIVDILQLEHLLTRKSLQLSGGEAQRVAIGRALLSSPELLLLDEPLTGLDIHLKAQLLPFLKQIETQLDLPMIYVTHHRDELEYLNADIAYMQQGSLVYDDRINTAD